MILKNLWRRKTRTLLTLLGVAFGVAAVVALSAFGEGFASSFEKMFATTSADLTVSQADAMMAFLSAVDDSLGDELRQVAGVEEVAGEVFGMVQMDEAPYFIVMGEDPRSFTMQRYRLISGQPITTRKQILLGKLAAKNFKKEVGSTFRLNDSTYRVVGIYETGVSLEDGGAVMGLTDAQRAFDKEGKVSYYSLKVKDVRRISEVKAAIEKQWPTLAAARSGEPSRQTEMFGLYRSFGLFIGIFAVLVGGLGMMNTTLMSVFERTREIGVLRAVGWRRRRVVNLILGESLVLSLLGGLLGILIGIGLTLLVRLSPAVESLLQGILTPTMLAQALVIALLLGAVGGLYPAWRAAQLAPVEAMRYEGGSGDVGRITRQLTRWIPGSALRNLLRRPTRTLVTIVGIGLGVGFIVALSAMSEGMIQEFTTLAGAGQMDLVVQDAKASDLSVAALDERVADQVRTQPGVKGVSKMLMKTSSAPGLPYFLVFGADPREDYVKHFRIHEGRVIEKSRDIMIGRFAATSLKKGLGESIRINGVGYQIVGIYETGVSYEDTGGVITLREAQERFGMGRKLTLMGVQLDDPSQAESMARQLEAQFPSITVSLTSAMTQRTQDFATMDAILGALVALTMLVGGVVMMNAMLMSVFERTQEIGVLRAVGWRRRRIIGMVLVESLALSLLSALMGIGIGMGLSALFTLVPTYGTFLKALYSPKVFQQVAALALILGTIGGLYPAWRASRMQPIEALRYE
ncbi:MAG: ABC transporter permease [Anaerolineae bacterium]|nr:ABC transporter permease [Anaerolineae bacterium]